MALHRFNWPLTEVDNLAAVLTLDSRFEFMTFEDEIYNIYYEGCISFAISCKTGLVTIDNGL